MEPGINANKRNICTNEPKQITMEQLFLKYGFILIKKGKDRDGNKEWRRCSYSKTVKGSMGTDYICNIYWTEFDNCTSIRLMSKTKEGGLRIGIAIASRYCPKTKEEMEFLLTGSNRMLMFTGKQPMNQTK